MEKSSWIRALTTMAAFAACGAAAAQTPQVKVETGTIAASVEGRVESWKGIPYAAPPIGALGPGGATTRLTATTTSLSK